MPALVSDLVHDHLSARGWSYWHCIPGLKSVTIHCVGPGDRPVATISIERGAYDDAVLQQDGLWHDRFRQADAIEAKAERESIAMVLTEEELKSAQQLASRLRWELYKEIWVNTAPRLKVQMHTDLPVALPDDYRIY